MSRRPSSTPAATAGRTPRTAGPAASSRRSGTAGRVVPPTGRRAGAGRSTGTAAVGRTPAPARRVGGRPTVRKPGRAATRGAAPARRDRAPRVLPPLGWVVLVSVGLLTVIGLVAVASASSVRSMRENDGWAWAYFTRQLLAVGVGIVAAVVAGRTHLRRFDRWSTPVVVGSIVGLLMVLLPTPISRGEVNGARRWLDIGPFDFQPSELAKLAVVIWVATLLSRRRRDMGDWRMTILPVGIVTGLLCGLIILEPDLGTVVVIVAVVGVMLVVAGARLDVMAGLGAVVGTGLAIKAFSGYHAARWAFLDPLANANDRNYQLLGSLGGVASGGWFGVGPGGSKAKWGYLPEAHTDAIFAVVGEEYGFVGSVLVISLYAVLIMAGLQISRRCSDAFGRLAAIGITAWVGFQAFINIGVSVGLLPNKGFTLPFVSYGGSSQAVLLLAAGILVSASRHTAR